MLQLRVNLKPFLNSVKKRLQKRVMNRKLLHNIGRAGAKHIKSAQMLTSSKGERIRKGVGFTVGLRSVLFHLDYGPGGKKGAGFYQNRGVRRHQMTYLAKSKKPIPLIAKRNNPAKGEKIGDTIFRWASRASMSRGSWIHPGYPGKKFFEKGLKNMRAEFKERVQKDISAYISNG